MRILVSDISRGDVIETGDGTRITVSDALHQENGLSVLMHHVDNCVRWSTAPSDGVVVLAGTVDPDTLPPLDREFETAFGQFVVSWDMDGIDEEPKGPMPGQVIQRTPGRAGWHCGRVWQEGDAWAGQYQTSLSDDAWPVVSGDLEAVVGGIAKVWEAER